jgi:hypothetical protein
MKPRLLQRETMVSMLTLLIHFTPGWCLFRWLRIVLSEGAEEVFSALS